MWGPSSSRVRLPVRFGHRALPRGVQPRARIRAAISFGQLQESLSAQARASCAAAICAHASRSSRNQVSHQASSPSVLKPMLPSPCRRRISWRSLCFIAEFMQSPSGILDASWIAKSSLSLLIVCAPTRMRYTIGRKITRASGNSPGLLSFFMKFRGAGIPHPNRPGRSLSEVLQISTRCLRNRNRKFRSSVAPRFCVQGTSDRALYFRRWRGIVQQRGKDLASFALAPLR